jgi:hypothetical protein
MPKTVKDQDQEIISLLRRTELKNNPSDVVFLEKN